MDATIPLIPVGTLAPWRARVEQATREHVQVIGGATRLVMDDLTITTYAVNGSRGIVYSTAVITTPAGIVTACTCLAGQNGKPCKHVALALHFEDVFDTALTCDDCGRVVGTDRYVAEAGLAWCAECTESALELALGA